MTDKKDNIRAALLAKGRELVSEKGPEFLTARKLSEASGYSVGTIYNQFAGMDDFICAQNIQTLDELEERFQKILPDSSAYKNLNRYVDVFVGFVLEHPNLWMLLYSQHLKPAAVSLPFCYRRRLALIPRRLEKEFAKIFRQLSRSERKLSMQVLWLSLFSLSSFLITPGLDNFSGLSKENICKLLLNTYLGGLAVLKRV